VGWGGKKGRQHIKARLGESVNYKWETKVLYGQYTGSTDSQFISNEDMFLWLLRGDLKQKLNVKRESTRSGITNKILCNQDITNRNRQQMQTISDKTIDHIRMPNFHKRTIYKET
jgi:hypothetical protein